MSKSSYCSSRWASVGTQMTEVIFSRSMISQMVWASVESSMYSVPMVMTLPRKPLVKDRSWPMEPTMRL